MTYEQPPKRTEENQRNFGRILRSAPTLCMGFASPNFRTRSRIGYDCCRRVGRATRLSRDLASACRVSALPFLEQAAKNLTLDRADQPVVIADYGCSQGKNSLAPMRTAVKRCEYALALIDPSLWCTSIRRRMISTRSSTCFTAIRNVIPWTIRTFFPQRLEGHSTKVSFLENMFISGGRPMLRCG